MYCNQCGAKNEEGTKFCTSCGAVLNETAENKTEQSTVIAEGEQPIVTEGEQPVVAEGEQPAPVFVEAQPYAANEPGKKSFAGLITKIIIAVVSVLIVVGAGIFGYNLFFNKSDEKSNENHPVFYVKDDQLFMKNANKKEAWTLSDEEDNPYYFFSNVQVSEDGKTVFFARDFDDDDTFKLYYRKTNQKTPKGNDADEYGVKIASGVTSFKMSKDGKFVAYTKDDRLYLSNLKDERSISSDVGSYQISNDSKKIIYKKYDGNDSDLYICGVGKKDTPEKIDSDVDDILSDLAEYNKMYYLK